MASKSIGQNRILQQMKAMLKDKAPNLFAHPLENDLFIWHFTILGPQNTDFHQGIYHGQIVLPFQYPFKPPDIYFFNKNGRFEVNTKICLTITQYHPQQWNTAWTIRTMLQAVISLFNQHVPGVGYIQANSETRLYLAKQSQNYVCQKCGPIKNILTVRKKREDLKNKIYEKYEKQQKVEGITKHEQIIKQTQYLQDQDKHKMKHTIQKLQIETFGQKMVEKVTKTTERWQQQKQQKKERQQKRLEQRKQQQIIQKTMQLQQDFVTKKNSVFKNFKKNIIRLRWAQVSSRFVKNT